jgi:LAS superfamily LD-carboxypeptidase LdcB
LAPRRPQIIRPPPSHRPRTSSRTSLAHKIPIKIPKPSELRTVTGIGGKKIQIYNRAASAWEGLVAASRNDGIKRPLLLPTSGYRSTKRQQELWEQALKKYGTPEKARKWVAPPGKSVHQTGRAIDFYIGGKNSSQNADSLRKLPAYKWLVQNASRFGFYPYKREPWHWVYNPKPRSR